MKVRLWLLIAVGVLLTAVDLLAGETHHGRLSQDQFNLIRESVDELDDITGRLIVLRQRLKSLEIQSLKSTRASGDIIAAGLTRETASRPAGVVPGYMLYFKATWCGYCKLEDPHFAKLKQAQWVLNDWRKGQQTASHIYQIDIDSHPEMATKYKAALLPLFVKMEGQPAVEVERHEGYLDLQQIQDMYIGEKRRVRIK